MGKAKKNKFTKKKKESIRNAYLKARQSINEINDLSGKEKIEYDIAELKSKIKNCEWDLQSCCKGNKLVIDKLNLLKTTLEKREEELKSLSFCNDNKDLNTSKT